MGKKFYVDVQRLVNKHGITILLRNESIGLIVLKNDMWKMFTLNGNYKWIDLLLRLMSNYNARKHRTIGMRPVDVTPAIAERLLATVYSAIKIADPANFKMGDSVRVNKYKMIFEKDYYAKLEHRGV